MTNDLNEVLALSKAAEAVHDVAATMMGLSKFVGTAAFRGVDADIDLTVTDAKRESDDKVMLVAEGDRVTIRFENKVYVVVQQRQDEDEGGELAEFFEALGRAVSKLIDEDDSDSDEDEDSTDSDDEDEDSDEDEDEDEDFPTEKPLFG